MSRSMGERAWLSQALIHELIGVAVSAKRACNAWPIVVDAVESLEKSILLRRTVSVAASFGRGGLRDTHP